MQILYILLIVVAAGAISSWSLRRWPTMDRQRYVAIFMGIVGSLGILRRNDPSSISFYVALFFVASSAGLLLQVWLRDKPRTS